MNFVAEADYASYCVGTRRKAFLDAAQIQKCAQVLEVAVVNNFETRMVAEIALYWIIYESSAANTVDLPSAQAKLTAWQRLWSFLFGGYMIILSSLHIC